eukprot:g4863.t1
MTLRDNTTIIASAIALLFLFYATPSVCQDITEASSKPYALLSKDSKYTTLVSLDGGGIRGIISVMVLVELEDSIKRHILEERPELLPEQGQFTSIEDFELSLADYIDCFAGTSTGSITALYLASKGGNGRAAAVLQQKSIVESYGVIVPTSVRALIPLYALFGVIIYPSGQLPTNILDPRNDLSTPGVTTPVFSDSNGLRVMADSVFGNTTLSQLSTSCFVSAFDLIQRTQIMLVYDKFVSPPKYGFTKQIRRSIPRSRNESFLTNIKGEYGIDILVGDAAIASAAAPLLFPAHEVLSTNQPQRRFLLIDGFLLSSDPTFSALVHIANSTGDTEFSRTAVLSIGTGLAVPNLLDNANGGSAQWIRSGDLLSFGFNLIAEFRNKNLQFLFGANSKTKTGQFLRIQPVGLPGMQLNSLLMVNSAPEFIPQLEAVGRQTAAAFSSQIQNFVKEFIMT